MVPLGVLLVILGTILRGILYIHKLPINRKAADTCINMNITINIFILLLFYDILLIIFIIPLYIP